MNHLRGGMIIDVNLDPIVGSESRKIRPGIIVTNNTYNEHVPVIQIVPITEWNEKKAKIEIFPSSANNLTKKSIADCLQTRPIDYRSRLVKMRGELEMEIIKKIDQALKVVFALS